MLRVRAARAAGPGQVVAPAGVPAAAWYPLLGPVRGASTAIATPHGVPTTHLECRPAPGAAGAPAAGAPLGVLAGSPPLPPSRGAGSAGAWEHREGRDCLAANLGYTGAAGRQRGGVVRGAEPPGCDAQPAQTMQPLGTGADGAHIIMYKLRIRTAARVPSGERDEVPGLATLWMVDLLGPGAC